MQKQKQVMGLIGWLGVSFVAAALGAAASLQARAFYAGLVQPAWAPPAGLFGPVWTVLYTLMAIAAWLVWRVDGWRGARTVLALFLAQLAFNALWSWLFFAWHQGGWAFADIVLLWSLILATTVGFWRSTPLAGAMLVPYLAWVSFATVLNYVVWQLNPGQLG